MQMYIYKKGSQIGTLMDCSKRDKGAIKITEKKLGKENNKTRQSVKSK